MIEFYPEIRLAHVGAVIASGVLFFLRGLALAAGWRWPLAPPVRYLTYAIDTVLLTAALMLMTILRQYPFVHAWLTVKVVLLVVYIVLGYFAFHVARRPAARVQLWGAAVIVYVFIVTVARAHHPWGALRALSG